MLERVEAEDEEKADSHPVLNGFKAYIVKDCYVMYQITKRTPEKKQAIMFMMALP